MIPTFLGLPIFGAAAYVNPEAGGASWQMNSFPGVNGTEDLFQGDRGLATTVNFELVGDTLDDLRVARNVFYTLQANGTTGVLTDSLGQAWPLVKVMSFKPASPVAFLAGDGVSQGYTCVLRHQITPDLSF